MKTNYIRQLALFLLVLCMFAACSTQTNVVQTPTLTVSATPCLGLVATPAGTPPPWVYGDNMDKLAASRILIKDAVCTTPEEMMRTLVVQWFEIIKKNSQGRACGLKDYKIDALVMVKNTNTPQYDLVATIGYRVKPQPHGDCGWFSPGKLGKDGWITTYDGFGIYRENGYFKLKVLPGLGI